MPPAERIKLALKVRERELVRNRVPKEGQTQSWDEVVIVPGFHVGNLTGEIGEGAGRKNGEKEMKKDLCRK